MYTCDPGYLLVVNDSTGLTQISIISVLILVSLVKKRFKGMVVGASLNIVG